MLSLHSMYPFKLMRNANKIAMGSVENCVLVSIMDAIVMMSPTIGFITTMMWELVMCENPSLLGKLSLWLSYKFSLVYFP